MQILIIKLKQNFIPFSFGQFLFQRVQTDVVRTFFKRLQQVGDVEGGYIKYIEILIPILFIYTFQLMQSKSLFLYYIQADI